MVPCEREAELDEFEHGVQFVWSRVSGVINDLLKITIITAINFPCVKRWEVSSPPPKVTPLSSAPQTRSAWKSCLFQTQRFFHVWLRSSILRLHIYIVKFGPKVYSDIIFRTVLFGIRSSPSKVFLSWETLSSILLAYFAVVFGGSRLVILVITDSLRRLIVNRSTLPKEENRSGYRDKGCGVRLCEGQVTPKFFVHFAWLKHNTEVER
jgi:hypothetical protein